MTDYKYPIVYTAMPIIKDNKIVSYISSKSFLIEEDNIYLSNGQVEGNYKIVNIYNQNKTLNNIKIVDNKCINYTSTNKIFRTLESCNRYVRLKNEELFYSVLRNEKDYDKINILLNKKEKIINRYRELEYQLLNDNLDNIVDISDYKKRRKI